MRRASVQTEVRGGVERRAVLSIALCFSVAVLEGFDIQAIGIAAPRLAPEFGLNPAQMGWVFAISNIGLVIGAATGGWLADRIGRKPALIGSVLAFGVFTFLTTRVSSYEMLCLVRLLTGLGFGGALPNLMAIASEVSRPDRRAFTASLVFCGMPLGGALAALMTQGALAERDWRFLFVIGGVLPLLVAPALWRWLPETLRAPAEAGERTSRARTFDVLFGGGRAAATLLLWLAFFPTLLVLYIILNWLPTLVVGNGLDRSVAPQASFAFNLASVAGAIVFGKLVDLRGMRWPLTGAYACLILVLVALGQARELSAVLWLSGAAGFFVLGANYALYGVAAACYPHHMRGTGSGASIAVGRLGSFVGPLAAGVLLSAGGSATSVVQYLAPMAAIAGAAVFLLSRRPQVA